jgi:hypothetical protein
MCALSAHDAPSRHVPQRAITARHRFAGPWWVAAALLGMHPRELVAPQLEELHARLTSFTTVTRRADVHCGPLERAAAIVTLPLHWRDARDAGTFPEMHGHLRLIQIDDNTTEVEFSGQYRPPFGILGVIVDAVIGHRLAQRTVDEAVQRIAANLEAAVRERVAPYSAGR